MNLFISKIFGVKKPVVGMLHLDELLGQRQFITLDNVVNRAKRDIKALEKGGIDGILIENWKEDSVGEFISLETAVSFSIIVSELAKSIRVPFGINVLNNDYKVALSVAKLTGASFVQLDVFVDHVMSDFKFSPKASKKPFEIKPDPQEIKRYARRIQADKIPLFVFIQPKHYRLLEKGKKIEESAKEAIAAGASALIVTKETGVAPTLSLLSKVKSVSGDVPVGIGSGFSLENAESYLKVADFAIVGTSIKIDEVTDNPVDTKKVKGLMNKINSLR